MYNPATTKPCRVSPRKIIIFLPCIPFTINSEVEWYYTRRRRDVRAVVGPQYGCRVILLGSVSPINVSELVESVSELYKSYKKLKLSKL